MPNSEIQEEPLNHIQNVPEDTRRPKTGFDLEKDIGLIKNLVNMADKDVRRSWSRVERVLFKKQRPRTATSANNNFMKSRPLTDACAAFYGGTHASRVDLTRKFSAHVNAKDLRVSDNKRYFRLDPAMQAALNTRETECTWTKLPSFLKNCFSD